jgi:DNA-binding NarL/FixJ family response regulator
MTTRVILAEDNPLLRDGISLVLHDHGMDVVSAVDNADDLILGAARHEPDVAIIDVRMPPTHTDEGIRAALELRRTDPELGLLVFSQWIELSYARQLLADDPAGIGYLLKDRIVSTDQFINAVERVATGGTALDPDVVAQLLARPSPAVRQLERLTPRELGVLARLADGLTNQAIAEGEHLAIRSVEKVISSVFQKLDLIDNPTDHRRVLAVLRFLEAGP